MDQDIICIYLRGTNLHPNYSTKFTIVNISDELDFCRQVNRYIWTTSRLLIAERTGWFWLGYVFTSSIWSLLIWNYSLRLHNTCDNLVREMVQSWTKLKVRAIQGIGNLGASNSRLAVNLFIHSCVNPVLSIRALEYGSWWFILWIWFLSPTFGRPQYNSGNMEAFVEAIYTYKHARSSGNLPKLWTFTFRV